METPIAMDEPRVQTRAARRAARTEKSLRNAALDVFLDRGLGAATIEEITDRADVGKGTFYIYYSSKTAVFEDLVCTGMKRLMTRIRAAVKDVPDLRTTLTRLVEAELQQYQEDPQGFRLIAFARTLLQLNEIELPDSAAAFERYFSLLESMVRQPAKLRMAPGALRRVAILLANVSSGYLSFAAFDLNAERMMTAFTPVRDAMINAIVELIESQQEPAGRGQGDAPDVATAKGSQESGQ